ncbi:MAG: hypothetical protein ACRC1P_11110 [Cellulosilyticaceae bacterium]
MIGVCPTVLVLNSAMVFVVPEGCCSLIRISALLTGTEGPNKGSEVTSTIKLPVCCLDIVAG